MVGFVCKMFCQKSEPKFSSTTSFCKVWLLPLLGRNGWYVLNIHFFIELVLKLIQFNIHSKLKSGLKKIFIFKKSRVFIKKLFFLNSKIFIQKIFIILKEAVSPTPWPWRPFEVKFIAKKQVFTNPTLRMWCRVQCSRWHFASQRGPLQNLRGTVFVPKRVLLLPKLLG